MATPDERQHELDGLAAIGALERRLEAVDRLSTLEAQLAEHAAILSEKSKAEERAQTERQLAAAQVQTALQDAATAAGKALEAAAKASQEALTTALKSADALELSRIEKIADKVIEVKEAATLALAASEKANTLQSKTSKETLDHHNELLKQMNAKDATYASKDAIAVLKDTIDKRHVDDLKRVNDDLQTLRESRAGAQAGRTEIISYQNKQVALIGLIVAVITALILYHP